MNPTLSGNVAWFSALLCITELQKESESYKVVTTKIIMAVSWRKHTDGLLIWSFLSHDCFAFTQTCSCSGFDREVKIGANIGRVVSRSIRAPSFWSSWQALQIRIKGLNTESSWRVSRRPLKTGQTQRSGDQWNEGKRCTSKLHLNKGSDWGLPVEVRNIWCEEHRLPRGATVSSLNEILS